MAHGAQKYSRSAPTNSQTDQPPPISIRYFYNSPLQIDDPHASVPLPTTHPSGSVPQPFSNYDNEALERTWNRLRRSTSKCRRTEHKQFRRDSLRYELTHGLGEIEENRRDEGVTAAQSSLDSVQCASDDGEISRPGSAPSVVDGHKIYEHSEVSTDTHGLTGRPFVRAPARDRPNGSKPNHSPRPESKHRSDDICDLEDADLTMVPVGVARIHQVRMANLKMEPIYWRSVHDVYPVIRGTWFYKDTMLPVEADIANLLEKGYLELQPWSEAWKDELSSAVEVGALGEEKIAHLLWPDLVLDQRDTGGRPVSTDLSGVDELEEARERCRKLIIDATCNFIEKTMNGLNTDNKAAGTGVTSKDGQKKLYLRSSVVYADGHNANILRPSLAPSAYYGRRPYANYIREGLNIGISVVRGFDLQGFNRLHRNDSKSIRDDSSVKILRTDTTDLILVIHGIGHKVSERIGSYHFTHAINGIRRDINAELKDSSVRTHLRQDMGGIMVLPINWRSTLSFDEGGFSEERSNMFSLTDITPDSIPTVRNIISDVMLDIPYYLSHHQPRIISAVVQEANRIYRLWCRNNPGFKEKGRVHLIAHSLGSVMAMDILSKQPTTVDPHDMENNLETPHFVFETKNLFLCGSPAGFFLLLKRASLVPRKGRKNSSSGEEDWNHAFSGLQNTYGCLAVDNVYNIVNPYDPVAYRLNATIDPVYAASLKPAYVPSSSKSWFASFPKSLRGRTPANSSPQRSKPPPATQRLPSTVELEVHNFTREEIAETRARLLNDNGQIDYILRYGGGPLEIQYLTMLGAHSSYWISKDFVRFVVIETGRAHGRDGTLEDIRAVKRKPFPS